MVFISSKAYSQLVRFMFPSLCKKTEVLIDEISCLFWTGKWNQSRWNPSATLLSCHLASEEAASKLEHGESYCRASPQEFLTCPVFRSTLSWRTQIPASRREHQTHRFSCLPDPSTWLFHSHKSFQIVNQSCPVFPELVNIPYLSLHPFTCSSSGDHHTSLSLFPLHPTSSAKLTPCPFSTRLLQELGKISSCHRNNFLLIGFSSPECHFLLKPLNDSLAWQTRKPISDGYLCFPKSISEQCFQQNIFSENSSCASPRFGVEEKMIKHILYY